MNETAQEIARSRLVTAYGLIESLVNQLDEGWPLGERLLAELDVDREVVLDEGSRAMQAIDAFAQQFNVDVQTGEIT